ncbi:MAG: DUF3343 domain-containing protein [Ruminococcaceae bacterium]|nr:DUF3343 domain-containing protein [Oscillospiraceae bacterium]
MAECIIAMKSQTSAERARRAAVFERIYADVVSIDPSVTRHGCSLGIRLPCSEVERMKIVMDKKNIPYGDVIGRGV